MIGLFGITKRHMKLLPKKYRAPCSRVLHADSVGTFALSHSRVPFANISGIGITTLEVFYTHWSYNATLEWVPTSVLTIRAAVEYPVGTFTPLYDANGNRDLTLNGGDVGLALKASGLNIPANAVYYIRTRCIATGGDGSIPRTYTNGNSFEGGTIQGYTSATNDSSDYTLSGNQPTNTGKAYGPSAVCSFEKNNKKRSFAIFGDSISRGSLSGGVSFAESGITGAGYSYINFAFSGARIQSNTVMQRRRNLMKAMGITDVVMNFPVNDLINSRTVAQIQTDFNTLWTNLKSDGIQRIVQATCLPNTTNTTSPGTIVATPAGAFTGGLSSFRSQVNTWLRSVVGQVNKPDYVFEFADALESARDSGLWLNPTVNTADGLHPSATGATTAGNALKNFLQTNGY